LLRVSASFRPVLGVEPLRQALDVLETFEKRRIEFRSLTDQIDTTTPMGKCMYQVRNAFAELERSLISERTKAGMEAARSRGKHIGGPRALSARNIIAARAALSRSPKITVKALAAELGVSPQTLTRALK
jgi:DNA invertase Pin-like site-specific DNA recombinase